MLLPFFESFSFKKVCPNIINKYVRHISVNSMEYSYSKVTKFNSNFSVLGLAFFSTGIAYLLYFYLKKMWVQPG